MKASFKLNFLAAAAMMAAASFCATSVPATAANDVAVQDLTGLQLSGYAKDDLLQWTISAKSAELTPESQNVKDPTKNGVWKVNNLQITLFSDGARNVEMRSANALFSPKEKSATSDEKVNVSGELFSVQGSGWAWKNGDEVNRIEIKHDVVVTLLRMPKTDEESLAGTQNSEPEKVVVTAENLVITNDETGTLLRFGGNVVVLYGEIYISADALEIELPMGKGDVEFQRGESGSGGLRGLSAISSIRGVGNALLRQKGMVATADQVEFLPSEDKFFGRGNVKFSDTESDLHVNGELAVGNVKTKHFELTGKEQNGVPAAIEIDMPSFAMRQKKDVPVNPLIRASARGNKLLIDLHDAKNVLSLDGNVVLRDQEFTLSGDWMSVKTARGNAEVRDQKLSNVKSAIARGNVKATSSAQILTCAQAEVFPQEKRVLLTGGPTVESPADHATLYGHRAEIFYEDERMIVESNDEKTARVTAILPAMSEAQKRKKSGAKNLVPDKQMVASGDFIEVTHSGEIVIFDIDGNIKIVDPELTASADRVVIFALDEKGVKAVPAGTRAPQIQRIDALGNVVLENASGKMTGAKAVIENHVAVQEWLETDEGGDGERPVRVTVSPDPQAPQSTRPRFFVNHLGGNGGVKLALPKQKSAKSGKSENSENSENSEISENSEKTTDDSGYIEGDSLEVLIGEKRVRFWLRNAVRLAGNGAQGQCNSVEGILLPQPPTNQLGIDRILGRGNVFLDHDSSTASGNLVEIFPLKNLAVLSGNAKMVDDSGVEILPGDDRFIFDTEKRELTTSVAAEEAVGFGKKTTQVSRPKITILGGNNSVFVLPAKKQKSTNQN